MPTEPNPRSPLRARGLNTLQRQTRARNEVETDPQRALEVCDAVWTQIVL